MDESDKNKEQSRKVLSDYYLEYYSNDEGTVDFEPAG